MTQDSWPLSAAQRGIWLGQALAPDNPIYWTAELLELSGAVDGARLQRAIDDTLQSAQTLRVRYVALAGEPCVEPADRPIVTERIDLSRDDAPDDALARWIQDDLRAQPALDRAPLHRSVLVRLDSARYGWYLRAHHVALDGYGYHLVQSEVVARYRSLVRGAPEHVSALRGSLRDASRQDAAYRRSAAFEADRRYWVQCLRGSSAARAERAASGMPVARVARVSGKLPAERSSELHALARGLCADVSAVLLAALAIWLNERTGRARMRLGLAITGRLGTGCERLPCMAMNVIAVPIVVRGQSFADLAREIGAHLRASRAHARYRYEDLRLDLQRAGDRDALFDCVLNWIPFAPLGELPGASLTRRTLASGPVEGWAVTAVSGQQRLTLEADASRFAMDELAGHHAALARVIDEVASGSIDARHTTRAAPLAWLVGPPLPPAPDVIDAIAAVARAAPEQVAIEHEGRAMSYGQLWQRAQSAAHALAERGVQHGARVAVILPRSPEMVIAQLAVLLAGGTYLPMDPDAPAERNRFVLEDARPVLVLRSPIAETSSEPSSARARPADGASGAYVIYTSGSTGAPRGVEVSRGALASFTAAARQRYGMTASDRVLQLAALQFDASVEEIYVTLTAGATLILRDEAMLSSFHALHEAVHALRLTVLDLPTAYFHALLAAPPPRHGAPEELRLVIIGGEAASCDAARTFPRVFGERARLLNTYGPTEATVVCSAAELDGSMDAAPIGTPLPGVTLAVLDGARRVVPRGEVGELSVLGPTLATGYVGRPQETADRFIALQREGRTERAYLTGDLAYVADDGQLRFVGRADDELKISGHRVHPRDVEAAVAALPGVTEAAVIAVARATGDRRLVAFYCGESERAASFPALLRERLSPPAMPNAIHHLAALPRDGNGKVDRKRLRACAEARPAAPPDDGALSALERGIVQELRALLGEPQLDAHADFFDNGGHSLLALRAVDRLSTKLGVELAVSALFEHRSARALAAHVSSVSAGPRRSSPRSDPLAPVLQLAPGEGPALFCVHPVDGAAWCYAGLAQHLPGVPVIGLQSPGLAGAPPDSFSAAASDMIARILSVQPTGPFRLLGWSAGGGLAHAVACGLRARGHRVSLLAMLDSHPAEIWRDKPAATELDALISMLDEDDATSVLARGAHATPEDALKLLIAPNGGLSGFDRDAVLHIARSALAAMRAYRSAVHPRWSGPVLYFRANVRSPSEPDYRLWQAHVAEIEVVDVPCRHLGMCSAAALRIIGRALRPRLS